MSKIRNTDNSARANFIRLAALILILCQTGFAQLFTIEQTLSDQAQGMTISFDGLAFLTGTLGSDSFFPPGKVADFWGFQYLRDNDPSRMGHNTDFLTRAADNMFYVLTHEQRLQLIDMATAQISMIEEYGYNRFVLMKAFRRLLEGDVPSGSSGLDSNAIKAYSSALYQLDGRMCYQRAQLMGSIIYAFTSTQKSYLDSLVGKGMLEWPIVAEQSEMQGLSPRVKEAVMTYAGDMFSWYAGSVEADVYFCPERQGTYFGSFYMKDAPAVGNPGYSIDTNMTADYGKKFLEVLSPAESSLVAGLVDIQRPYLYEIVDRREDVSIELRKFMAGQTVDSLLILNLMDRYGQLDGEIVYHMATNFATVNSTLNSIQRDTLMGYRDYLLDTLSIPAGAYLYATAISMPDIPNTDFLFASGDSTGSIGGLLFFDENQNGIQDVGEYGLEGWKLYLQGSSLDSATTNSSGVYTFALLDSGTYTLRIEDRDGWTKTFPAANETTLIITHHALTMNIGMYNSTMGLYQVQNGWNLISIPQTVTDYRKDHLFTAAISSAFAYNTTTYQQEDTLVNGVGYWLKFPSAQNLHLTGLRIAEDTFKVMAGWNLIGSISDSIATSDIFSDPPGMTTSEFFGYEQTYVTAETIVPGKGYWVKVNQSGSLILSSSSSATPGFTLTSSAFQDGGILPIVYSCDSTGISPPLEWTGVPEGTVEFAIMMTTLGLDGMRWNWVLYGIPGNVFSLAENSQGVGTAGLSTDGTELRYYPPCAGGPGEKTYTFTIYALSGTPTFGVPADQVSGDVLTSAISSLILDSSQVTVTYTRVGTMLAGKVSGIKNDEISSSHIVSSSAEAKALARIHIVPTAEVPPLPPDGENTTLLGTIPNEYALGQAYPNPFNPTTTIRYELPVDSKVQLAVYNVLGQSVTTLTDNVEAAGVHSVVWDAQGMASGVYFYKLEAASILEPGSMVIKINKVVLMK